MQKNYCRTHHHNFLTAECHVLCYILILCFFCIMPTLNFGSITETFLTLITVHEVKCWQQRRHLVIYIKSCLYLILDKFPCPSRQLPFMPLHIFPQLVSFLLWKSEFFSVSFSFHRFFLFSPVHCSPGEYLTDGILCKACRAGTFSPGISGNTSVMQCTR